MGILDRFRRSADDEGGRVPEPDLNRPYATVRYKNETGGYTEQQVFSAEAADDIKAEHPDAVVTPKRGR